MVVETKSHPRHFVIVAGEASGDQLGARLIVDLQQLYPDANFCGIGGPQMIEAGFKAWFPAEKLSVMGLVEVIAHLPELLRIRREVIRRASQLKPDCFIGIDVPDFNLKIERKLKEAGIRTVHYVSPSIWAWREKRAEKIGRSTDLILCLFPMEPAIYARYGVPAQFVGHPLADEFPPMPDKIVARKELNISREAPILALLPGSRVGEIRRLGPDFIEAALLCKAKIPQLQIIAPMANDICRATFSTLLTKASLSLEPLVLPKNDPISSSCPIQLIDSQSHRVLQAADAVLLASGTATLEALLARTPMVVAYRLAWLSYWLVKWFRLLRTSHYSLPNILVGRLLVPELMQEKCTPEHLASALLPYLESRNLPDELATEFSRLHTQLRPHADQSAALAIAKLLDTEI